MSAGSRRSLLPRLVGSAGALRDGINVARELRDLAPLNPYEPPKWYEEATNEWSTRVDEARTRGDEPPEFLTDE